jgi:Predicted Zn-dependent protease (DUF2268)
MARFARLLFALSTATVVAAAQARVPDDPSAATFVYDDLDRFARAIARIRSGADALATIEAEYFAPATPGLKALIARKGTSAAGLAADIGKQPAAYAEMAQLVERLKRHEPAIRRSFASLEELYPDSVFPPVFYLASDPSFGGGLADPAGVLIAFGPRGFEDVVDRMPHLVAHELAHVQQAMLQGIERYRSIYGPNGSLLAIGIREGSADLIAQLTSGGHINPRAHAYGIQHEYALWRQFQKDMNSTATGDWMFVTPSNSEWPQDLGYFVGYRISEAYYRRAPDKARALRDILSVTDYRVFLNDSGYNP